MSTVSMNGKTPHTPAHVDGRPARVMIAGINYWPEEIGIAPYTTGLAQYLASSGYEVTVLTGMPYYPEWRVRGDYRHRPRSRETVDGVEIRRYRTYVPDQQSASRRILFESGFFANCLLTTRLPRPDAIIGVVPNLGGAGIAALLSKRFRVPYGLIFQDLVGAAASQSGIPGGSKVAGVTRAIEGWCARGASMIGVVSEGFIQYLVDEGVDRERIVHLPNWSHIQPPNRDRDEVRRELGWTPDQVVVLHSGNMGLKQGLENVIDCARIARACGPNMLFVLIGDGNQREHLQELASDLPNVQFLPPRPEEDFPNTLAAADILLLNQRPSVTDMSLPGKLTSYFMSGRPVVAAVAEESLTAKELAAAGASVIVPASKPELLFAAIRDLAADPKRASQLGLQGRFYADTHLKPDVILPRLEAFARQLVDGEKPNQPQQMAKMASRQEQDLMSASVED